jgi:hypothetical protein
MILVIERFYFISVGSSKLDSDILLMINLRNPKC